MRRFDCLSQSETDEAKYVEGLRTLMDQGTCFAPRVLLCIP